MVRTEIIRSPVVSGSEIYYEPGDFDGLRRVDSVVLPSGERVSLDLKLEDLQVYQVKPKRLSLGLRELAIRQSQQSFGRFASGVEAVASVKKVATEVLENQFGLGWLDSRYWAEKIADGYPLTDKLFPHWVFTSILVGFEIGNYYRNGRPKFISDAPNEQELAKRSLTVQDIENYKARTPPTLVGTAVPLIGNVRGGYMDLPEFTLLRRRLGSVAGGTLSFPGGGARSIFEFTAFRELDEEMNIVSGKLMPEHTRSSASLDTTTNFLGIVDQVLLTNDGKLKRFLNYVFGFEIGFPYYGGGPRYFRTFEEVGEPQGESSDGLGEWEPVSLPASNEVLSKCSPIAKIGLNLAREKYFRS